AARRAGTAGRPRRHAFPGDCGPRRRRQAYSLEQQLNGATFMSDIVIPALIGVVLIAVIGIVFTTLYRRSTRDEAFVRTGLGGKRVVLDGGAVVLPIFHSTARVNLKTLRLQVERSKKDSLITKDRLRVDIGAEFYVRVRPDAESIALAAQTLGDLTNDAEKLRAQVEAKFVDGLRSVAATTELLQL